MTAKTNRQIVLRARPDGIPQPHHFARHEAPLPRLPAGGVLVRNRFLSVDPAMRVWLGPPGGYIEPVALGAVMRSFGVGEVVQSDVPDFAPGDQVVGLLGWQDWAAVMPDQLFWRVAPRDLPLSLSLGVLGINGIAAYIGISDICRPRAGETVVVSTAAGAVGSAAGQIARAMGARTVGITSDAVKARECIETFGFDAVTNYRNADFEMQLRASCPDGVDAYFDNTAGAISDIVRRSINPRARIALCGTAGVPAWQPWPQGDRVERHLLNKRALMQGFVVTDHVDRYDEALTALAAWVRSGALRYNEHILEGLEAAPSAIARLYDGANHGKLLIRLGD